MSWDALQWPAMAITVMGSMLVASRSTQSRNAGFWTFILSNVLWIAWGVSAHAYALVVLQMCLAAVNVHGERQTDRETSAKCRLCGK